MSDHEPMPRESSRRGLGGVSVRAGAVARWALRAVRVGRRAAWLALETLLALVILFEEWGWRPLAAALASFARLKPIAALEAAIARLPPWPALLVFALPSVLLLPLKLAALWLIAKGHVVAASALFVGAKIAGTAVVARLFQLTRPALMQLAWFAWTYETVMPWKEALIARVRASAVWQAGHRIKVWLAAEMRALWVRLAPAMRRIAEMVRASLPGR